MQYFVTDVSVLFRLQTNAYAPCKNDSVVVSASRTRQVTELTMYILYTV